MDPAAVLHVLVKVEQIDRANQQIRQFDDRMQASAQAAERMDREVSDLDGTLKKAASTTTSAARATRALDGDLKRTTASTRTQADATASLGAMFGGLVDDVDDFTDKLAAANGVQVQAASVARQTEDAHRSLASAFGAVGDEADDYATVLQRAGDASRKASEAAAENERTHSRLGATWARVTATGRGFADRLRDVGGGGRDGGNGIRKFLDDMGDLPGKIYLSTRLLGALGNALLIAAPPAIAMGGALFAIGSALAPIAGLGAGAAAGLVAIGQAMGAVKLATAGVGDAIKASAKGPEEFEKALKGLPPAAQAFAREVVGLKPKLDDLRSTAASGLFPGVTDGLRSAMGSFGSVKKVVGETATELGGVAERAGELVGSSAFGKDIETIGGRNAKVLGTLGDAAISLVDALRNILVEAGPLTQWLADTVKGWSDNAAAAAKAGRENGKLADFFDKTRERAELLGSIIGNLAGGLFGMGKASDRAGASMLKDFDGLTERFADWANSVKGRNEIAAFMDRVRDAMKAIGPALGALLKAFGDFAVNVLPAYARVMQTLAPVMDELVTIFIAWKIAATGAAIATGLWTAATKIQAGAQWLLNAAMAANPIVLVVLAVAALVAAFVIAYKESETFRKIVDKAWGAIKDAAEAAWAVIKGIFAGIIAYYSTIFDVGKGVIEALVDGVKATAGWIAEAAGWVKNRIVEGIQAYINLYKTVGTWVLNRIVEGVKVVTGALAEVGGWIKNRIVEGVQAYVGLYKAAGSWVINRIAEGVKIVTEALASVGGWIKNRIVEGVQALGAGFIGAGTWVINRVADGITTVTDKLGSVGGWLKNRVVDLLEGVKDGFLGAGKSIIGWIADGFKSGVNAVIGFVNKIIDAVNAIPGVPNIKPVAKLAEGGQIPGAPGGTGNAGMKPRAFARGGAFGMTGGQVSAPMALLGEEAPRHPEWVIPTNPAYRSRALGLWEQAGSALGVPGFAVGGAITDGLKSLPGVGPIVQGLDGPGVSAGDILKKLPNPKDMLPQWLLGTGDYAIREVTKWIKDKVKSILPGDGGGGGGGGSLGDKGTNLAAVTALAAKFGNVVTSGYRPGDDGYHGQNRARDYAGGSMLAFAKAVAADYGSRLLELIHTPLGWGIKNGKRVGLGFWGSAVNANHLDHVHVAMRLGGMLAKGGDGASILGSYRNGTPYVPQTGPYLLHRGERVETAEQNARRDSGPLLVQNIENYHAGEDDEVTVARLAWINENL